MFILVDFLVTVVVGMYSNQPIYDMIMQLLRLLLRRRLLVEDFQRIFTHPIHHKYFILKQEEKKTISVFRSNK